MVNPKLYTSNSPNNNNITTNHSPSWYARHILLSLSFIGLVIFSLSVWLYSKTLTGPDAPGCRSVYMSPTYARVYGLDESHTRFASKYSLYLYREQGKDVIPNDDNSFNSLTGAPVLFIPGNAGSYRQVRSIAAESANVFYESYKGNSNENLNPNAQNLDFFSSDFNEDFTAFHGRTMLDQAEYLNDAVKFILSLYKHTENPPRSVIIVGHSMGGIVARVMVSLPNYNENSINTIVTLATPHAAAPLTFDGDILKVYSATDRFWREAYQKNIGGNNNTSVAHERLKDLSLISITGGLLDSILPADYTSLTGLVPLTNGFTVYTTGIPGIWTPIDHLAIVWCDQLRKTLSKALIEITNFHSADKTYSLEKRMRIFRSFFLSGFEEYSNQDLIAYTIGKKEGNFSRILKLDNQEVHIVTAGEKSLRLTLNTPPQSANPKMNLFYIPQEEKFRFSLLSSVGVARFSDLGSSSSPSVLLCRNLNPGLNSIQISKLIDYTNEKTTKYIELECIDAAEDAHIVPFSRESTKSVSESSIGGNFSPFKSIFYDSSILSSFDVVIVAESTKIESDKSEDFVIAQLASEDSSNYDLSQSLFTLFNRGADVSLPVGRPLSVNIKVPGAWSSVLSYKVVLKHGKSENEQIPLFSPLIRQWVPEPFESKWHVDIKDRNSFHVSIHGIAPFTPFSIRPDNNAMNLELWSDSIMEDSPLDIFLTIDLIDSLRLLVLRYRLAIVSFSVAISVMVLFLQFRQYNNTGVFPNFFYGLSVLCEIKSLITIFIILSILSPILSCKFFQRFVEFLDLVSIQDSNEVNRSLSSEYHINSYFLGLQEYCLWFVGPIFYIMALSLSSLAYSLIVFIGIIVSQSLKFWVKIVAKISPYYFRSYANEYAKINSEKRPISPRRLIGTFLLLSAVPFYIPYQFAYVICCSIQVVVTLKLVCAQKLLITPANLTSKKSSTYVPKNQSIINLNISLLILMLWILPINIPVLIVWVHNFSVNWKTPFSSHHNFLAIMPIVLAIERQSTRSVLPKVCKRGKERFITELILAYFVFYSLIYGIRHTFWLHHLLNFFFTWLLYLYYDNSDDAYIDKDELSEIDPKLS